MRLYIFYLYFSFVPVSSLPSPTAADDDDDEDETTQQSRADADDDGRIYKNPRNSPSAQCPRDEEQATLLVRTEDWVEGAKMVVMSNYFWRMVTATDR